MVLSRLILNNDASERTRLSKVYITFFGVYSVIQTSMKIGHIMRDIITLDLVFFVEEYISVNMKLLDKRFLLSIDASYMVSI
ncbi:hypothetical protein NQ317_011143 [Molorchus minor]|uniref:Uncharacterized protein n=1 Tax=Molorchus minor TaxID=1323400 RepID=A0ABQ9JF44_9CUCU|nr:hypothetical protein NQ317_011143 [Molorchus minor]